MLLENTGAEEKNNKENSSENLNNSEKKEPAQKNEEVSSSSAEKENKEVEFSNEELDKLRKEHKELSEKLEYQKLRTEIDNLKEQIKTSSVKKEEITKEEKRKIFCEAFDKACFKHFEDLEAKVTKNPFWSGESLCGVYGWAVYNHVKSGGKSIDIWGKADVEDYSWDINWNYGR